MVLEFQFFEIFVLMLYLQLEVSSNDPQLKDKLKTIAYQKLHILKWLPKYTRANLVSDLIAGITVGMTLMPQSISYASIVEHPPHCGLYTAIMGPFLYIFFGTIKQVSIGPSSTMYLLCMSYLFGLTYDYYVIATFICGCMQLVMAALKLGFLIDFISSPVTSGFTSAISLSIIEGQLKYLFGIKIKSGGSIEVMRKLAANFGKLKMADTCMGLASIVVLLTIRYVSRMKFEEPWIRKSVWYLGICRNALVVLVCSVIAFVYERGGHQPFTIVGQITPGLPSFKLPNFTPTVGNTTVPFGEVLGTFGSGIIILPLVGVLANVAIAKAFAKGTIVDATQEMMTLGIVNLMGSFVGAVPMTGAFTRSAVNDASNVQTPLSGLFTGTIILLALSFLTPSFYYIPRPSIAAVLICAVVFMIEYQEVPKLWRCCKFDLFVGVGTFVVCFFYSMEMGLLLGVALNLGCTMVLWNRPRITSEVSTHESGLKYLAVKVQLGLLFPGVNHVTEEITKITANYDYVPIVLDMSRVITIDYTGCKAIVDMHSVAEKKSQPLVLVQVEKEVLQRLRKIDGGDRLEVFDRLEDVRFDGACTTNGESLKLLSAK